MLFVKPERPRHAAAAGVENLSIELCGTQRRRRRIAADDGLLMAVQMNERLARECWQVPALEVWPNEFLEQDGPLGQRFAMEAMPGLP